MAITLVGAWSLQGSTTNYGNSASLASPAVNVPAGALIATGCSIANGIVPSVSDTAGNTYTVLPLFSGTATGTQDVYVAYCLSAKANTANVVTWSATGQNVQGNNGAVYSTSSGTWAYDTDVSGEQGVGYGTNLNLSITTAGAGLIAGLFFEYYAQAQQPWTLTGLTQQAVTQDTSTGTGAPGNVYGDYISTAAQTAYAISATDGTAGLAGGKVTGFAVSFTVASSTGTAYALSGTAGSFSVTGNGSSVNAQRKVSVSAGSFAVTGQAASLNHARFLQAAAGAFSITGQMATGKAARTVAASAGSFAFAGQPATLTLLGVSYTLSASAGLFAVTGNAAVVNASRQLAGATGNFTLSGQLATLNLARHYIGQRRQTVPASAYTS